MGSLNINSVSHDLARHCDSRQASGLIENFRKIPHRER